MHIAPPCFKRSDWKFCCPSLAKTGDIYYNSFFNGPCTWSRMPGFYEDKLNLHEFHVLWRRATVILFTLYRLTFMQVHTCEHTRARAHTHFPACSFSLSLSLSLSRHIIMHCHANKATFWNTNEKEKLNSIIFTHFQTKIFAVSKSCGSTLPL